MTLPYVQIPDQRLTENFTLYEFLRSNTAAQHGIDNTPDAGALERIAALAVTMQDVRDYLGWSWAEEVFIDITSGYRSPALNAAVGGSDTSDHMEGGSADFTARTRARGLREVHVARALAHRDIPDRWFDQLLYYRPSAPGGERIHLGVRSNAENRREVMTKAPGGWLPGIVG